MPHRPICQGFVCYQPGVTQGSGGNTFFSACPATADATICYRHEVTAHALPIKDLGNMLPLLPQIYIYLILCFEVSLCH